MSRIADNQGPSLYGRPIETNSSKGTLTSQVHTVLLEEIQEGRWQVGDRLPGVSHLAEETGISRWAFQRAYERLREAGYLKQERGAGSFLISSNPRERVSIRTVGVLMPLESDPVNEGLAAFAHDHLRMLMRSAEKRGYEVEVEYLRAGAKPENICKKGGVFDNSVHGIISLAVFPHSSEAALELTEDEIPFVHWGANTGDCLPVVGTDTQNTFYRLTQKIIGLGHREILLIGEPEISAVETAYRYSGHAKAMKEAGLVVNVEAYEASMNMHKDDLMEIRQFLEKYSSATAILSTRLALTMPIVSVLEMMGRRVPQDVSVTGNAWQYMPQNDGRTMARIEYDSQREIEFCFTLLEEQIIHRRVSACRVLLAPVILDGDSLGPAPSRK